MASDNNQAVLQKDYAFFVFGIGVHNFLNMQWALVRGFCAMSIIAILQLLLIQFSSSDYHNQSALSWQDSFAEIGTIGRYAQSHSLCKITPLQLDNTVFKCSKDMKMLKIFSAGIVDKDSDLCLINEATLNNERNT